MLPDITVLEGKFFMPYRLSSWYVMMFNEDISHVQTFSLPSVSDCAFGSLDENIVYGIRSSEILLCDINNDNISKLAVLKGVGDRIFVHNDELICVGQLPGTGSIAVEKVSR